MLASPLGSPINFYFFACLFIIKWKPHFLSLACFLADRFIPLCIQYLAPNANQLTRSYRCFDGICRTRSMRLKRMALSTPQGGGLECHNPSVICIYRTEKGFEVSNVYQDSDDSILPF